MKYPYLSQFMIIKPNSPSYQPNKPMVPKNLFAFTVGKIITSCLLLVLLLSANFHTQAQAPENRDGSIDLTNSGQNRYIRTALSDLTDIENGFTFEAWVYMTDNGNKNFNLFRMGLPGSTNSLDVNYGGDDERTGDAWIIETRGLPEDNGGNIVWELPYTHNIDDVPFFQDGWHHVAFRTQGPRARIYIDGELTWDHLLKHDGGLINSLVPSSSNPIVIFDVGGISQVDDHGGTFYASEIRLWGTNLTATEIDKYYDEEVNSSHPEWDNLLRYFHGNESESAGSNRSFPDESPNADSSSDAVGSHTDVSVHTEFTPIVRPPAFDNSTINASFTASTCDDDDGDDDDDDDILVTWDDFNSSEAYKTSTTPSYEVTRDDDGVIYTENGGSVTDNLSPGDKHRYNLKTYWHINDSPVYSDDEITSNYGSVKEKFEAVTNLSVDGIQCDRSILLTWSPTGENPPQWSIKRTVGSNENIRIVDGAETSFSYSNKTPETEYSFTIIASGTDDNGCIVSGVESDPVTGYTSEAPKAPTDLTVSVDLVNIKFDISWTNPANSYATGYVLRRTLEDGSFVDEEIEDPVTTSYSDNEIVNCTTYTYSIASTNGCTEDYEFSDNSVNATAGEDLGNVMSYVTASKGYFGHAVLLEWGINGSISQIPNGFKIGRTVAGEGDYTTIKTVTNDYIFEDQTASAGVFYNYKVTGQATCNGDDVETNPVFDLGFRQPFGIANGHVEYAGGNAVENVAINFERQDGENIGNSLNFDGIDDHVAIDGLFYEGTDNKEVTVEAWVKTSNDAFQIIASYDANSFWQLAINNNAGTESGLVAWAVNTDGGILRMLSATEIVDEEWHHVSAVYDNGVGTIYIDGVLDISSNKGTTFGHDTDTRFGYIGVGSEASSFNEQTGPNDYFEGNIDEVRIWSVARSETDISKNYNRVISNEQSGLELYYRCDEGTGESVYDASKDGETFNKHDGTFNLGTSYNIDIPTAVQLGTKGLTDEYGDYSVDYIPYNGSGDIFRVSPSFGQHVFTPSSRSIYLGDGAAVQNDLNYTDISFFTVRGVVQYKDTNVPVENVTILVDGVASLGADNMVVRSDQDGKYEINVPIGRHYISVEKEGHVFNKGFWPALDDFGVLVLWEFTDDETVNFFDDTKVKVAGRVVGGNREAEKILGFGLSTNNVGVADLTFSLQNIGYQLGEVMVSTNDVSGEYEVELIPEQFLIGDIDPQGDYFISTEDIAVLDLRNSLVPITVYDPTAVEGTEDEFSYSYHHKLNFVIQEDPEIRVLGEDDGVFNGDLKLNYIDQDTGDPKSVDLTDVNPFVYPLFQMGFEYEANVYLEETYTNPFHPDYTTNEPLIDKVPVSGADITITDNIGVDPTNGNTGKTDEAGHFSYTFRAGAPNLAANGSEPSKSYTKTFEVNADINGKGVAYSEEDGEIFRAYVLGSKPLEGTGFVTNGPDQVDFVLRDPPGTHSYAYLEKGSSYSMSEGWSIFEGTNTGLDYETNKGVDVEVGGGLAGPVVKVDIDEITELGMTLTRGYNANGKYTESYDFTERIETSSDPEDVGTDADLFIGKSTNVLVSKTNNLRLVNKEYADNVGLEYLDTSTGDLVLAKVQGFAIDNNGTPTYFMYSHRFILENLIPDLLVLRDDLLASSKYVSHFEYGYQFYGLNNDDNSLDELKQNAEPGTDILHMSYTFIPEEEEEDQVEFINDQITMWVNQLAINEADKVNAELVTNLSLDGSGGEYTSEVTQGYSTEFNTKSSRTTRLAWNSSFGLTTNGAGVKMKNTFDLTIDIGTSSNENIDHNMTFGYVIDERDEGDYYSIDVKTVDGIGLYDRSDFSDHVPSKIDFLESQGVTAGVAAGALFVTTKIKKPILKYGARLLGNTFALTAAFLVDAGVFFYETGSIADQALSAFDKQDGVDENLDITGFKISSPVFSVRGGASRCPYEGGEAAMFYATENNEPYPFHTATLKREIPTIDVEPAIQANIPEEEQAVFTLKMGNESETSTNIWYKLSIDESTNPDGAIILIDGLTAERQYLVNANEILEKTLTIEKGATGILEYDNIGVVLHSVCQFNPESSQEVLADTVFVTARFLAECSEVAIANMQDNWIINYANDGNATVTLDGYNVTHPTIEKIDFQYKTLTGTPVLAWTFFKDAQVAADAAYDGPQGTIDGASEVSFDWDISSLTDGEYQIRARAHCSDGSVFESDYLTGLIDTSNPQVFGTPEPADGIYNASDDIRIQFSEELEAGLIQDFHLSVRSVLNGADVSHATSVQLQGAGDDLAINNISFNGSSFTIEYWLENAVETTGGEKTIFTYGSGSDLIKISQSGNDLNFQLGTSILTVDPSDDYTTVTPWNSWHHWAFVYDNSKDKMLMYLDDKEIGTNSDVIYNPSYKGQVTIGDGQLEGKMHELRMWKDVRSFSEITSNMSATLSGSEAGLYGYWPLDEGSGDLALDKTASRNAIVEADWFLDPGGFSWEFDGSNYLSININNITIGEETDMTVEFWFRGNNTGAVQGLFSNGLGDGTDQDVESALSIIANESGQIHVMSNGYDFQGTDDNFTDGDWHHLAFVVDRRSTAKMYIDGALQNSATADNIAGLSGAEAVLGARVQYINNVIINTDGHLSGNIDEVRFWKSARSATLINTYMNTKVNGDEIGLVSYHAFETYETLESGTYVMESTLEDLIDNDLQAVGDAESSDATDHFSEIRPAVKDVRGTQDLSFNFVVNGDEIIISPIVDASRIEGQIVEFSVLPVKDLNGNSMLSPVTWTSFSQQNQVKWDDDVIDLEKHIEEDLSFTVSFTNESGTPQNFNLDNIPAWLSADITSGVANPQQTITITFEVNEAVNIGSYDQGINLTTDEGFDEKLQVSLRVFDDGPNWILDESEYAFSMSVFGRLIIEGDISNDANDRVAAFVGDEIRAVGNLEYVDQLDDYRIFLSIFSNEVSNETIELRVYDASTGQIHENVTPQISFVADGILGTILSPVDIEANNVISKEIVFQNGWNWFSVNLDDPMLATVGATFAGLGIVGDQVKNQFGTDIYDPSGWSGGISDNGGFVPDDMYKVYMQNGGTVKLTGVPFGVNVNTQSVGIGWNYVGYTPQVQMTLQEALVSISPNDGDLIKIENKFAMFASSFGWIGSLDKMEPSQGYMLFTSDNATLTYPERGSLENGRILFNQEAPDLFEVATNSEGHNMSIIAEVSNLEEAGLTGDHILVAFHKEEIRGHASAVNLDGSNAFFLSAIGKNGEDLVFKLYDVLKEEYYSLEDSIAYGADRIVGTVLEPVSLSLQEGMFNNFQESQISVYPNPFTKELFVHIPMEVAGESRVRLFDINGRIKFDKVFSLDAPGMLKVTLQGETLDVKKGVYLLQVQKGQTVQTIKVIR